VTAGAAALHTTHIFSIVSCKAKSPPADLQTAGGFFYILFHCELKECPLYSILGFMVFPMKEIIAALRFPHRRRAAHRPISGKKAP
jgi:hypothetical protein